MAFNTGAFALHARRSVFAAALAAVVLGAAAVAVGWAARNDLGEKMLAIWHFAFGGSIALFKDEEGDDNDDSDDDPCDDPVPPPAGGLGKKPRRCRRVGASARRTRRKSTAPNR